ncbi:hypothetical protein FHX42_005261 [Saccharopolyspora lacisalsi]|uniref:Uncharacterized protein n=1 Tax=Halosaccharopolyspora lacisalsi TaxID=1000566 RepID=A0A839E1Y0_9PSEU|nr:hypothetical protein [Halosaccharopolyspora lacisalsi]MBA8827854.1 hypothetical protein [Halosaccharopolyspora lacisalsi]
MDTQSRIWAHVTTNVLTARLAPLLDGGYEHYVEPTNSAHVRVTVLGVHSGEHAAVLAAVDSECQQVQSRNPERWILVDCFDQNGAWLSRTTVPGRSLVAA